MWLGCLSQRHTHRESRISTTNPLSIWLWWSATNLSSRIQSVTESLMGCCIVGPLDVFSMFITLFKWDFAVNKQTLRAKGEIHLFVKVGIFVFRFEAYCSALQNVWRSFVALTQQCKWHTLSWRALFRKTSRFRLSSSWLHPPAEVPLPTHYCCWLQANHKKVKIVKNNKTSRKNVHLFLFCEVRTKTIHLPHLPGWDLKPLGWKFAL